VFSFAARTFKGDGKMSTRDAVPCIEVGQFRTDVANSDAAVVDIPAAFRGYAVRRVTVYDAQGGSSASATLSVRGGPGGTGTSIVADAALTGVTGPTVVSDRTVAATGVTPLVTDAKLYFRIGTASGVAGTTVRAVIEISRLP
jgi:hypothetical protein